MKNTGKIIKILIQTPALCAFPFILTPKVQRLEDLKVRAGMLSLRFHFY